jgi:hypothetical protein
MNESLPGRFSTGIAIATQSAGTLASSVRLLRSYSAVGGASLRSPEFLFYW